MKKNSKNEDENLDFLSTITELFPDHWWEPRAPEDAEVDRGHGSERDQADYEKLGNGISIRMV